LFRQTGFTGIELVGETGFNSSPITKGLLFRAKKPLISIAKEEGGGEDALASLSKTKSSKSQGEGREELSPEEASST
jgi:hypothetical protein